MNSYDIVANEVKRYWNELADKNLPVDNFYIVHFYQKYEWSDKWEECTEIIECQDGHHVDFMMDFCEGQTQVKDLCIYTLYQIGQLMGIHEVINALYNWEDGNEKSKLCEE